MMILTKAPGKVETFVIRLVTVMFFCVLYYVPFLPDKNFSGAFVLQYYLVLLPPSVFFFIIMFYQKTIYFDQENLTVITKAGEQIVPLNRIRTIRVWFLLPCWISYQGHRGKNEIIIFIINAIDFVASRQNSVLELRRNVDRAKLK